MIGVGAVGAVIASQLTNFLGKENVECLADGERKARYERDGIFINGEKQDFNFVESKNARKSDLVIIATKNLQLGEALKMMKNAYGEKDNSKTERTAALEKLFSESEIKFKNPENIHLEMWKKFLINTVFNTLSAITRSPYGGFRLGVMQNLARKVGSEVIKVANAENVPLTSEMLEDDIKLMCSHDPHGKTSMLQDIEAGRKSENAWFCGTVANLAKKHGIAVPFCEFLRDLIEGTEEAREI